MSTKEPFLTRVIKCQKAIPVIPKKTKGQIGNREYYYADLPDMLAIVNPILWAHGLAIDFEMDAQSDGDVLRCILFDEDGNSKTSSKFIPLDNNPQKTGSDITYYRRYLIAGLLNISIDFDGDGNHGGNGQKQEKEYPKAKWPHGTEASKEMTGSYFATGGQKLFKETNGCELIKIGFKYYTCPVGTYELFKNQPERQAYTVESLRALNYEGLSLEDKEKFDKENPF